LTPSRSGDKFQEVLKPPPSQTDETPLAAAELEVADMVGKLMHFWGFKRPMGRIWTLLYLSPEPLSAGELGDRLRMSAGGVSMALSALEEWGCVHRSWVPGERRDYFAAEDDIWKMVQRVLRQRELLLVAEFEETLTRARGALEPQGDSSKGANKPQEASDSGGDAASQLSYKRDRLSRLLELTGAGQTLLAALVAGNAVDPTLIIRGPRAPGSPASQDPRPS
jgi:DNA-binding transcriptional regulator GbsR (MarR family)